MIVTSLDPVYLEPLVLRGTRRVVIPENRAVAFASRVVTPVRIDAPIPPPTDANDHRCPGLLAGGAREVVAFTADEKPERIAEWVRAGRPVFVDTSLDSRTKTLERLRAQGLAWSRVSETHGLVRLYARR